MGILVSDSITLPNGIVVSNFIISIRGMIRSIEKTHEFAPETDEEKHARILAMLPDPTVIKYRVIYTAFYYANGSVSESFYQSHHNLILSDVEIQQNIFDKIYSDIKSRYTNYTDI